MSQGVLQLIAEQMNTAVEEMRHSSDWYYFCVEPRYARHGIPMDGDFATRRWWFVLRPV